MARITSSSFALAVIAMLLFSACTNDGPPTLQNTGTDSTATAADTNGISGMPSPLQMILLMMNADAPYNSALLNPHAQAERYSGSYKQALNLGVYQADLGYIIAHQQTQTAMDYFKASKTLADKLGILGSFDTGMMDRAEKNLGNKDSLMQISSNAFADAGQYLDENKRPEVSDLIAVGGWVESTYLATQMLKSKDDPVLRRRIGQDKMLVPQLIAMVEAHPADADHQALAAKLHDLNAAYANVKIVTESKPAVTDSVRKVTRIGSKTKIRYKKEDLAKITDKIEALRKEFVQ